jgi:hypothetical protein
MDAEDGVLVDQLKCNLRVVEVVEEGVRVDLVELSES